MSKIVTVAEGEHIAAIAARQGYASFDHIWNHDANASLRAIRKDPLQLLTGDQLVIPEPRPNTYTRQTGAIHTFVVQVEKLVLRLRVLDYLGKPLAAKAGSLTVTSDRGTSTEPILTDSEGVVTAPIERTASSGRLEIGDFTFELAIGALGPATESSGVTDRLANLGFGIKGPDSPDLDRDTPGHLGVELLQAMLHVDTTGEWSESLAEQLVDKYGS